MKILFAGSELTPFARTSVLGDVLAGLPAALLAAGHEVSVVLPCYRGFRDDPRLAASATGVRFTVPLGDCAADVEVLKARAPNGVSLFLVRHDPSFDRAGLYSDDGSDFPDDAERFVLFSKCVVELARRISPAVDIVHLHDWHAALVPALIKARRLPFKTVLTIHSLASQGSFPSTAFPLTNLPWSWFAPQGLEFYGKFNLLKSGILFGDAVTGSERLAHQAQTPAGGDGLEAVLRENAHKITGVLNGIDSTVWDPATDKLLPKTYKTSALSGKKACRAALLKQLNLAPDPAGPVFGMVTPLSDDSGVELLLPVIDRMLSSDARLVVVGPGESAHERDLMIASRRHRDRMAYVPRGDDRLVHLLHAGADAFLMPSHGDPCGLTAMSALKYGALPIAQANGSAAEIVPDHDPRSDTGCGFLFYDASAEALWDTIKRAKKSFADTALWKRLTQRAMGADFSWSKAGARYEEVYLRLVS